MLLSWSVARETMKRLACNPGAPLPADEDGSFPVLSEDSLVQPQSPPLHEKANASPKLVKRVCTNLKALRCASSKHRDDYSSAEDIHDEQSRYRQALVDETLDKVVQEESETQDKPASTRSSKLLPMSNIKACYEELSSSYQRINDDDQQTPRRENPKSSIGSVAIVTPDKAPAEPRATPVTVNDSFDKSAESIEEPAVETSNFQGSIDITPIKCAVDEIYSPDEFQKLQQVLDNDGVEKDRLAGTSFPKGSTFTAVNPFETVTERATKLPQDRDRLSPMSFSSLSSFGIPADSAKPTVWRRSRPGCQGPTPHPFFWRSHPHVTVTSYDTQLPHT